MALVSSKGLQVGLNGFFAIEKDKANSIAGNPADECPRVLDHASDAPVKVGHIKWPLGRQNAKFLCRKATVPGDIGSHFFGGLPGESSHGGANHSPQGKNVLMDGHQVNHVAWFAAVGSGGRFIRRKIHGVQYVAEKLDALRSAANTRRTWDCSLVSGTAESFDLFRQAPPVHAAVGS